ncbi:MAG TPA: DUF4340 domain-containing protein [Chloroflexota bacterium]|nr:DUF4340 domain-containing protein [Chloroflexota bacterium]
MNIRFTLGLLVVAALVVIGVAIGQAKAPQAAPAVTPTPVLFNLSVSDVTNFDIRAGAQETDLASSNGKWSLVKPSPDANVDQTKISDLVGQVAALNGTRDVASTKGNLAPYGLDKPNITVTMQLKTGKPQVLLVGSRNVDGNYYYAMPQGGSRVSLISSTVVNSLSEMAATPPRATPTPTPTNTPLATATPAHTAQPSAASHAAATPTP